MTGMMTPTTPGVIPAPVVVHRACVAEAAPWAAWAGEAAIKGEGTETTTTIVIMIDTKAAEVAEAGEVDPATAHLGAAEADHGVAWELSLIHI